MYRAREELDNDLNNIELQSMETSEDEHEGNINKQKSSKFTLEDVKRLILSESNRIKLEQPTGKGRVTKLWTKFKQILVDSAQVPFLKCNDCNDIFEHTTTSSTTNLKKHADTHLDKLGTKSEIKNFAKITEEKGITIYHTFLMEKNSFSFRRE